MNDSGSVHVLGIALVVEEVGEGANLLFRYPVAPSDNNNNGNLFWKLSSKAMEKLFRTKSSLCGQPMTLLVGDTLFCCRSISTTSTSSSRLVMFSVVVVLHHASSNRQKSYKIHHCIRNVHISLTRLCRALEREEIRCSYMSRQTSLLLSILSQQQNEKDAASSDTTAASSTTPILLSPSSPPSSSSRAKNPNHPTDNEHYSSPVQNSLVMRSFLATVSKDDYNNNNNTEEQEQIKIKTDKNKIFTQQLLDQMITATNDEKDDEDSHAIPIYGNLARELAQTYHALSRNYNDQNLLLPTPLKLLTCRDGIIYINGHVAVPMESIKNTSNHLHTNDNDPCSYHYRRQKVRPYHTLFFPNSPQELLSTNHTSSNNKVQSQILSMIHPCKSLQELAMDTAIPLPIILEYSSFLVSSSNDDHVNQNICIVAPVITPSTSRYVLSSSTKQQFGSIMSFSLHFMQHFGIPMPIVLSAFTTPLARTTTTTTTTTYINHTNIVEPNMDCTRVPITLQHVISLSSLCYQESNNNGTNNSIHHRRRHHHLNENIPQQDQEEQYPTSQQQQQLQEDSDDSIEDDPTKAIPESIMELTERLVWLFQQPVIKIPSGFINSLVYYDHNTTATMEDTTNDTNQKNNTYKRVSSSDSLTNHPPSSFLSSSQHHSANATTATATNTTSSYLRRQSSLSLSNNTALDIPRTIENSIITMVVWLRSHGIITELKDFLTKISDTINTTSSPCISVRDAVQQKQIIIEGNHPEEGEENNFLSEASSACEEELLYQELLQGGFLNGNLSIQAITWKLGLSIHKLSRFIQWGQNEKKIAVITRPSVDTDDWGAP